MVGRKLLTGLGVVIAVAALSFFVWRPLLIAHLTPPLEFEVNSDNVQLKYSELSSWAAHPDKHSAAKLTPEGVYSGDSAEAAVFFIHPTTYFGPNGWNWKPDATTYAAQGIEHVIATNASAFNVCCDIYAPFYRQAHIGAFEWDKSDAGLMALDLAYEDIEVAFDEFLRQIGPDSLFFLAGHSQGSALLHRLITERVTGREAQERMTAAYMVGYWLPATMQAETFPDIPFCTTAEMTRCVITWNTYDEGAETLPEFDVPHWLNGEWQRVDQSHLACINPLTWQNNVDPAAASMHLGAVEPNVAGGLIDILRDQNPGFYYKTLGQLIPSASAARCGESGKLWADTQISNGFAETGYGDSGSYHAFDWNLFYMNIRQNIAKRLDHHLYSEFPAPE